MRPADKLQVKAAKLPPLDGLARSKENPINHRHGAQHLHRPRQPGPSLMKGKLPNTHATHDRHASSAQPANIHKDTHDNKTRGAPAALKMSKLDRRVSLLVEMLKSRSPGLDQYSSAKKRVTL